MKAFKLFRRRKDGTIGPLFINAKQRVPIGVWLDAEDVPTKGFARRPGWHCGAAPCAPHLKQGKAAKVREWFEVEIEDFKPFKRPTNQGGEWLIASRMKVVGPLQAAA